MPKVRETERGREGLSVPDRGETTARVYDVWAQILHERARMEARLCRRDQEQANQGREEVAPRGQPAATEKDVEQL